MQRIIPVFEHLKKKKRPLQEMLRRKVWSHEIFLSLLLSALQSRKSTGHATYRAGITCRKYPPSSAMEDGTGC